MPFVIVNNIVILVALLLTFPEESSFRAVVNPLMLLTAYLMAAAGLLLGGC